MDLASFHLQLLKLRVSASVEWDGGEEEQSQEPMGFSSPIESVEVPAVEEVSDVEDRHLGFRAWRS